MKVCIFGAGSVGVHYARAWSKVGANVNVFDISAEALERFASTLWSQRYGVQVPDSIQLNQLNAEAHVVGTYDLAVVGTPPATHSMIVQKILDERSASYISIQKPVCTPRIEDVRHFLELEKKARLAGVVLMSGYNHRHSPAFTALTDALTLEFNSEQSRQAKIGVEWLESWDGILRAHPWLRGPEDSYLGFTELGGGACFEHSHGLDLGLFIWAMLGAGVPEIKSADFSWYGNRQYDSAVHLELQDTHTEVELNVRQNVVESDHVKRVSVSIGDELLEVSFSSTADIFSRKKENGSYVLTIEKNREADFDGEIAAILRHIHTARDLLPGHPLYFGEAFNASLVGALAVSIDMGATTEIDELRRLLDARLRK